MKNNDDTGQCCAELGAANSSELIQSNECSSKTIQGIHDIEAVVENLTDSSSYFTILKDIKDQIEEIRQLNSNQFSEMRNTIENNKVQHQQQCTDTEKRVEKIYKEIKDTITLQHRETRRRFERLEKKTNTGHFNDAFQ